MRKDRALRVVHDAVDVQSTVHLGQVLRAHREQVKLTQEQAAVRAGITRGALAALEKKQFPDPHLSTLLALMLTYRLGSLEALLGPSHSEVLAATWQAQGWQGGKPSAADSVDPGRWRPGI
ncbi:helix-turn-helix transcriptional regulator [Mycobacteroides abscessus]